MRPPTTAPTLPAAPRSTPTTGGAGRLPMRPLDLHPTPSQLSRSERATAQSSLASRGLRFRWVDEPPSEEGAGDEGAVAGVVVPAPLPALAARAG